MARHEFISEDFLKYLDSKAADLGGSEVDANIEIGRDLANLANEVFDEGNTVEFEALNRDAAILIGRKSLGALELQAEAVRREAGPTPCELDPELAERTKQFLTRFALAFDVDTELPTDGLLLETARAMHRMKATSDDFGPSVMAPIELWNRRDVLEEAFETGMHPWVAWSVRGTADKIDESTPLYGEFIATDIRVRMEANPTGEY